MGHSDWLMVSVTLCCIGFRGYYYKYFTFPIYAPFMPLHAPLCPICLNLILAEIN